MWIVGPPNSHGMLVNMPKMGSTFITINSCGCNHVCHFQFWKKVTVKCEAYFFVLGCYMLQQMVLVTFRSATNYHYFLCCWPWHDELWGRLLLIFLDWKQELLKYHVPHVCVCVCVCSSGFTIWKYNQPLGITYTIYKGTFLRWFLTIYSTLLLCYFAR